MSDDAFLELLADCTRAANNLDLSDNKWMPPNGGYTVVIENVSTGIIEKPAGVHNATVAATFQIVDGEFQGKSFEHFCWIEPVTDKPSMGQKKLAQLATCLAGTETKDPIEGSEVVQASIGDFLALEVYRTTSKKNGKEYTNLRFLNTIEATDVEEATPVNATG